MMKIRRLTFLPEGSDSAAKKAISTVEQIRAIAAREEAIFGRGALGDGLIGPDKAKKR